MFGSAGKMSVEASDVQTDEDCDELEGFSFSADFLEKKTSRRRSARKPPPSPKSPYLTSLDVNPRRAAVSAWRPPRAASGDAGGEGGSARLTSLSNGHDLSPTLRSVCDVTLSSRKHKALHSASNGFTVGTGELRDKEDMYDEIIRLKKSLQAQKSDNHQMKAKLRRLEEDNAKREKQIEELLDPTKGSEYTRSFVDKKREGSVVLNGLKQRILKLEQQCREKENALSKLQSDLRTTNLEELKITVETYFEEIQRLKMLLEAAEKSSRAESKCSQRQQKALSSTVHRLSHNLKQLQQENSALREELSTDSPAGGVKGYREWSKQRLLRRLLEVEKRPQDSTGHAQPARSSGRLDREVQTTPSPGRGYSIATEATVSVGTMTEKEEEEEGADLRERLGQSEEEKAELRESLTRKDEEVKQLRTERETLEAETERRRNEQNDKQDKERRQHQQELEQLEERIRTLESAAAAAAAAAAVVHPEDGPCGSEPKEGAETDSGGGEREGDRHKEREKAAGLIQTKWREHRHRDTVMLQSTLRGHLLRESLLKDLLRDAQYKAAEGASRRSDSASPAGGQQDVVAVVTIQSAFRGHLARCCSSSTMESPAPSVPSPMRNSVPAPRRPRPIPGRTGAASLREDQSTQGEEDDLWPVSGSNRGMLTADRAERSHAAEPAGGAAADSDDSDDIIVSPSRPLRSREVLIL